MAYFPRGSIAPRTLLLGLLLGCGSVGWASGQAADAPLPPPELWSPRTVTACQNAAGRSTPCLTGDIVSLDAAADGARIVFASTDTGLVAGDRQTYVDVFVSQAAQPMPQVAYVSRRADGVLGDQHSDLAAISGNGRYVYFRSRAGNLVSSDPPVLRGHTNLYLKELSTGRLALLSRSAGGAPMNLESNWAITGIDADYSGRYVVFASSFAGFDVPEIDENSSSDIFWLDLDPDQDGDLFNTLPSITLLSATTDQYEGNGASFAPSITQDGRAVAFLTRATNLAPELASNGGAINALLVLLGRSAEGAPDPSARTLVPVNRMGDGATTLTPQGVRLATLDPWRATVVFVTAEAIPSTGDDRPGEDVYVATGLDGTTPQLRLHSARRPTDALEQIVAAWDPIPPPWSAPQVGWIAQESPRDLPDLVIQRLAPPFPAGLPAVNWPDRTLPSQAPVWNFALSPDGRYAFWTTMEPYGIAPPDTVNLYRRALAPAQAVTLTVDAGGGAVWVNPPGALITDHFTLSATTTVELVPQAAVGQRFVAWQGVDAVQGMTATVALYRERTVSAVFQRMTPPMAAGGRFTTPEDLPLIGIPLAIIDPDPDEAHRLALVDLPAHGQAWVRETVVDYVPEADHHGVVTFSVEITDAYGLHLAVPALITVAITPVNDAPRGAFAAGRGENQGTALPVWVTVDDPDGDEPFTLTVITQPAQGQAAPGTAALQGHLVYTPTVGFGGVDYFAFGVTDWGGASITATATVTVTVSNDPPPVEPSPVPRALFLPALSGKERAGQ